MPSSLNTGVPFAGGTVNSPGYEQQPQNILFGPASTSLVSHKFTVHESPILLRAYGLGTLTGPIYVQIVGEFSNSEVVDLFYINDTVVALTQTRNVLLIDLPGVYRLLSTAEVQLGAFIVTAQTTAMGYFSWGLAAYGNAVAVNNPIPPP